MSHSHAEIWISKDDQLPDICIGCGMYTDRRIVTRFSAKTETQVADDSGAAATGVGCLLMLLGPLGLLISLLMSLQKKETAMKTRVVTVKSKIKIPLCPMCESEDTVAAHDADMVTQEFAFDANPDFIRHYQQMKQEPGLDR